MRHFHYIIFLLPGLFALSASAQINVTATFNPPRIAMGERTQYVVEIMQSNNQKMPEIERITSLPIPQSEGLQFMNGRSSSNQEVTISNGVPKYSVIQQLIIDAQASHTGTFTIPSFTFQYKDQTVSVPAATLTVVERSADAEPTIDELIFLKTNAPEQLYVGQTTSIQLKLYISENLRLSGINSFDRKADGFTLSSLSDSQQSTELYQGRRYQVLTWPLTITPIQTGTQDLNFQFTVSAQMPDRNSRRRDPFGSSGFGSSIFDDIFGRTERFTVYTEPTQVEVLPLPAADQPTRFTGAIGDFALEVYTDRQNTQSGEPIMLSVEISGQGNFDRISGPIIPDSKDWRSYEPESKFQPSSAENSLHGTKRFDYVMIPNKAGQLEIPSIEFAYFEPEAKRYTRLNAPPIPIKVSPSDQSVRTAAPTGQTLPPSQVEAMPLQKELSMEDALLTLDYQPQPGSHKGSDPLQDSRFWLAHAVIALALVGLGFWLQRLRRLAEDPAFASQVAARRESTEAAQAARQAAHPESFYAHAQSAVRLALTARTRNNLRTANSNELSIVMQAEGIPAEAIEATRQIFNEADALRFAGNTPKTDLPAAKKTLETILKAI